MSSTGERRVIKVESVTEPAVSHLMPCSISFNGDHAAVSKYFTPCIEKCGDSLTASFRGRPLHGQEIKLPEGYTGIIVKGLAASGTFQKFTYWNWDLVTSENDKVPRAMDWIDISKAIHGSDGSGESQ